MRTYAPFSAEPVHVAPQPALHSSSLSPASHFLARRHWLSARPSCSARAPWLAVDHGSSGLSREKLCSARLPRVCVCVCVCVRVRVCPCQQTAPPTTHPGEPWFSMAASSIVPHGVRPALTCSTRGTSSFITVDRFAHRHPHPPNCPLCQCRSCLPCSSRYCPHPSILS